MIGIAAFAPPAPRELEIALRLAVMGSQPPGTVFATMRLLQFRRDVEQGHPRFVDGYIRHFLDFCLRTKV